MAIGLVLLAGVIALLISMGAWLLGFVTFGQAVIIYIMTGWAVLAAGLVSTLVGQLMGGSEPDEKMDARTVPMKVKSNHQG